ncbi:MAG: prepilin peptidase [Patescibacteria group bacterium]|nr:prepilin peptidase [Patescibacteria group bacterium]
MQFLIYFLIFIFGLIVGSFLNSVIYRLSTNASFLLGRSYCPECKSNLKWHDLIPIISFLVLAGKCRYCKKPISIQYILVELATAGLFFFIVFQNIDLLLYGFSLAVFLKICFLFIVSCFLIIIFAYDLKHYIIPDKVIFPLILVTGIFNFYTGYDVLNTIYSAFGASLFFLFIVLISKGTWMGMGDVKLAFFMGLFLGFPKIMVALFLAFFSGAVIGIILMISGKKTLKSEIPFGPFLIFGTFLALFFEYEIISFYLSLYGF